jgi:hypothetical protein
MPVGRTVAAIIAACWLAFAPTRLMAQSGETDPSETAHVRYGPLRFTPGFVASSGHDTNVYREAIGWPDYETFAVPQVEAWWKQPGFLVHAIGAIELVHFAHNTGATNTQVGAGIERLRSPARPFFNYNRKRTNANPTGFEVGYKSLRLENQYQAGANLKVSPRSEFRVVGRLVQTRWDADAIYRTSSLREKLNRDTSGASVGYAYKVTPLTAVGVTAEVAKDRFVYSPIRNGDTIRVAPVVEFGAPALLFGTAQVGYERFRSPAAGTADFSGLIASANIGYGMPDGTLVKVYVNRDTQYSFDTALAYYVMTSMNVTIARRIGRRWDSAAFGGRYSLDYRPPLGTTISSGRVNVLNEVGGAIACRVGRWGRIGWTVERASKSGPDGFNSLRLMGFLTYGSGRFQRLDRPTPFER